jgi:hypothetical protein
MKKLNNLKTFEEFDSKVEGEKLDEGLFGYSLNDFKKLKPEDKEAVISAFAKAFTSILNNPKLGIIKRKADATPFEKKYELLKVASEDNFKGSLRLGKDGQLIYINGAETSKHMENPFGGGGTGGGNFANGGATGT